MFGHLMQTVNNMQTQSNGPLDVIRAKLDVRKQLSDEGVVDIDNHPLYMEARLGIE